MVKNIFLTLLVFGIVGCASGTLAIFPIDEYKEKQRELLDI